MDVVCGLTAFMARQDYEQYPAGRYPVSAVLKEVVETLCND